MTEADTIRKVYEKYRDRILEIRRHLHAHPETGDREVKTTEYLSDLMTGLGLDVEHPLPTGLDAVLEAGPGAAGPGDRGKCVGLRADIDALPITEQCDLPFKSENDGVMHACGHDIHMSSVIGAAMILSDPEIKGKLTAPVKFIFQPAEETDGGAKRMIEAGVLESPHVDCMAGLHCEPSLAAGTVGIKYGYTRASSDMFDIHVRGKSAHGAYPETGCDAIVAASNIILAVQSIVSRNTNAFEPCVITIGVFQAGQAENVVCEEAFLSGTMRTVNPEVRKNSMKRLEEIVKGVAAAYGAEAVIEFRPGYIALLNNRDMTDMLRKSAEETVGKDHVQILDRAMMSVDDFSFFADKVPSVYFFAGSGYPDRKNYGLHHGLFQADETMLDTTVPLLALSALEMQRN